MAKIKKNLPLLLVTLICVGLCLGAAVTSDPWDGTGWNTSAPNDEALVGNTYKELQDLRKGIGVRMDKEHVALASSSVGGEHIPGGCAVLFYDDTTAVDANVSASTFVHDGLLFDTTLSQFFTINAAEDTKVAIEIGTAGIADANITTALIADANITTALIADANITTALIADANITTALIADANITTALIADANVTVAKMLYKDEDDMASDSATHVTTQQSQKAYVDAGAHKVTDGSVVTGYRYCSVNDGAVQQVFTKYFTGILDADDSTSVAHSVTAANILSVSIICYNGDGSVYTVSGFRESAVSASAFLLSYNATHIIISGVGAFVQGQVYRIRMDYTI